jgi:pSer/pThr/pTyr-binding forkhead associated (FHA) protein
MARVYRVRHAILDTVFALKVLAPDLVAEEGLRRRFLAEGRIMARVRHPAVVMVTDAVVDAERGIAGLVMELVEGPDLERVIARMGGPPSAEFVRALLLPICDAVHHVHQEGVVHRDLKPSNILLSRDAAGTWHPRITDFGVAWIGPEARWTGMSPPRDGLVGTPAYMAPEQAGRKGRPDPRWDVWSLGVLAWELATGGNQPFDLGDTDATLAALVGAGADLDPLAVHPGMDVSLAAAIRGALRRDPEARFPTAAAFAEVMRGAAPPGVAAADPIPDRTTADLEGLAGPGARQRFELAATTTLGSGPAATVRLIGPGIEPLHARVVHRDGGWYLEDTSVAGTRVNGARVQRIALADGDHVRLGTATLRFRTDLSSPKVLAVPALELPDGSRVTVGLAPVVIGRGAGCDLVIDHPTVSVRHARVSLQGPDLLLEDLHSANGTRVNGQRARFRRVSPGDVIEVGASRLIVR